MRKIILVLLATAILACSFKLSLFLGLTPWFGCPIGLALGYILFNVVYTVWYCRHIQETDELPVFIAFANLVLGVFLWANNE
jgi:hypothetical protein